MEIEAADAYCRLLDAEISFQAKGGRPVLDEFLEFYVAGETIPEAEITYKGQTLEEEEAMSLVRDRPRQLSLAGRLA